MSSKYLAELLDDDDIELHNMELIAEPTMQEFMEELEKYPKVRDKNHQGPPPANSKDALKKKSNSPAASSGTTPTVTPLTQRAKQSGAQQTNGTTSNIPTHIKPGKENQDTEVSKNTQTKTIEDDFEAALRAFLRKYYTEEDTEKVVTKFMQSHYHYIRTQSYDTLERVIRASEKYLRK